jgi:hypothetical protein
MSTPLKKQPVPPHIELGAAGHRAEREPTRSPDVRRPRKPKKPNGKPPAVDDDRVD